MKIHKTALCAAALICLPAFVYGLTIYGLTFAKNSAEIPVEAYGKMDELTTVIGQLLEKNEIPSIQIEGYTDSFGSTEYNVKLSEARAASVKKYIYNKYKDKGLDEKYFTVAGLGAVNFIADNTTDEGRSKNRRIELVITGKSTKTKVIIGETEKTEPVKETQKQNDPCWKCISLGAFDAVFTGFAVFTVLDQWKAADDYTVKYAILNNTDGSNYDELVALKKTVDDKKTVLVLGAGLASAALLYTAADYFWLHNVFTADIKIGLVPANNGVMLTVKGEY